MIRPECFLLKLNSAFQEKWLITVKSRFSHRAREDWIMKEIHETLFSLKGICSVIIRSNNISRMM